MHHDMAYLAHGQAQQRDDEVEKPSDLYPATVITKDETIDNAAPTESPQASSDSSETPSDPYECMPCTLSTVGPASPGLFSSAEELSRHIRDPMHDGSRGFRIWARRRAQVSVWQLRVPPGRVRMEDAFP